jgi:hypothetical protein
VRRVPFSYFALPDSFSAVPRASGPVFMFCTPGLIFGGTDGVRSCFHVLHAQTHFRQYRGCWLPFSCFALSDSFSTVSRASAPIFMFCASGLIFGGNEGVGSRFNVFHARTHCRQYRGCPILFSCFALPDMCSAVPSVSGHVFMFCTSGLVFGGTEGVGSRFHVLCSRTHFRRYGGCRVQFSCFVRP